MKITFANILIFLIAAMVCTSCNDDHGNEPMEKPTPSLQYPEDAYLNISVGVLTQLSEPSSRANDEENKLNYFENPDSRYECINSLRVIIVRGMRTTHIDYVSEDSVGYIEYNNYYHNFAEGLSVVDFRDDIVYKVRGGEKKKIYLIVNEKFVEDNTSFNFATLKPGEKYPDNAIENLELKANASGILIDNSGSETTYIPMSESYEIDVPVPNTSEDNHFYHKFFVTRSAVKFSFVINTDTEDYIDTDLLVRDIKINSVTNNTGPLTEFLMPRAVYSPDKDEQSDHSLSGRFVERYEIPNNVIADSSYTFSPNIPVHYYDENIIENQTKVKGFLYAPPIYFPESKLASGKDYTLTIALTGKDDKVKPEDYFTPVPLPNLSYLPRNTHVIVNITLKKSNVTAEVKLVPYIGVPLSYFFGFNELIPWEHGRPSNDKDPIYDVPPDE